MARPRNTPSDQPPLPGIEALNAELWSAAPRPWLRLWARWVDYFIWNRFFSIWISFSLPFLGIFGTISESTISVLFISCLTWIPVEAFFLSAFATTPGKWLFNLRVCSSDFGPLPFRAAISRAGWVWLRGYGLGLPLINLCFILISYFDLKKRGITNWDEHGFSQVLHSRMTILRVLLILVVLCLFFIFTVVSLNRASQI